MEFYRNFACFFCGIVSVFLGLLCYCCCVLAARADEAWLEAGDR